MSIEKLGRFDCTQSSNGYELGVAYMLLDSDGDYVLHSVARDRENKLLEALKALVEYENGIEDLLYARKIIGQIESTR